jgi:RNA polymerase sigma-70 factor (ECF subfamily)
VNAASRLQHYLEDSSRSLFIWFRLIVGQTMVDVYRRHLAAEMRDAGREVSLQRMKFPQATSASLAAELLGSVTSPSQAAAREEASRQLETALKSMSELDQEVIALRHFEDLTNNEVAEVLGIQPTAASNRYVRALTRLKDVLEGIPGFDPQQG